MQFKIHCINDTMEFVGFIKQHDNTFAAENYESVLKKCGIKPVSIDAYKVNEYLIKSSMVFGWMYYFSDLETANPIAPHAYYTDGVTIWPSYMPYYLDKLGLWEHYSKFLYSIADKKPVLLSKNELANVETILASILL